MILRISKNGQRLSHLMFVDDLILMAKADMKTVNLSYRDIFSQLLGQKINIAKSKMILPNKTPIRVKEEISN